MAFDAIKFNPNKADAQFKMHLILRELNKAFIAFTDLETDSRSDQAISTGKWGCGDFKGHP